MRSKPTIQRMASLCIRSRTPYARKSLYQFIDIHYHGQREKEILNELTGIFELFPRVVMARGDEEENSGK